MVTAEMPTIHKITVLSDKAGEAIFQAPKPDTPQDNAGQTDVVNFLNQDGQDEPMSRKQISISFDQNPISVAKILGVLERRGEIQFQWSKTTGVRPHKIYDRQNVERMTEALNSIKPKQSRAGPGHDLFNPDLGNAHGSTSREIELPEKSPSKHLTKKERIQLKHKVLKLAVRDALDEIIGLKTNVSYNIRIRLGNHLPFGQSIPYIFENSTHEELNDVFMQSFVSAFEQSENPSSMPAKNGHKSRRNPIDLEIQEKVKVIRQKNLNVDDLISSTRRMLALTVYQGKEKE